MTERPFDPGAPFDAFADAYTATVQAAIGASGESVDFFAELKVQHMAKAIGKSSPVAILDFGCGVGNATRHIAHYFPQSAVTGMDVSESSLTIARTRSDDRVRYELGDRNLPFDDASFDVAFTSCVFHHIEPPERARWVQEIHRVLRAGGRFFLFEHNPWNPLTRRVVSRISFDAGVQLLSAPYSRRMLAAAGFAASHAQYYFFFPRSLKPLRVTEPFLRRVPLGGQYYVMGTT